MSSITDLLRVVDLTDAELDTAVSAFGKCSGRPDDAVFFPDRAITREDAQAACADCPVIAECLERQLRHEVRTGRPSEGIFGATTPDERRKLRRNARRRAYAAQVRVEELEVAS